MLQLDEQSRNLREHETLANKIAVVTGGTAGVGRGIASELANCGARVFVTGRSIQNGARSDSQIRGIRCDHREDDQVTAAFQALEYVWLDYVPRR